MRKIILLISLMSLFPKSVLANEISEPYILTSAINAIPVTKEDCISLIQNQYNQQEEPNQLNDYQNRANELEAEYQSVNELIDRLQSDADYSIEQATNGLNTVIEEVYQYYSENDANFLSLDENAQLLLIQEDETVIAWQQYLDQIVTEQNEAIAKRDAIESEYQQLLYQIENETPLLEQSNDFSEQLNQCLLYPYSVEKLSSESYMLNQNAVFSEYLVQVDQILQKLVPYAYRKVSFEDIYQLYNKRLDEIALREALYGKENIVIDEWAMQQYSYERELNVFDIEIVSNLAQKTFLNNQNDTMYKESYLSMLKLKESQFHYFVALNISVWERLKQEIADYLNRYQLIDESSIKAVQQLHNKNQVKLVIYDTTNQLWRPVSNELSGYLEEFQLREFQISELPIEETTLEITTIEQTTTKNNLDFLKEKLSNQSTTQVTKEKPNLSLPNAKKKTTSDDSNKKGISSSIKLPSTGEQRQLMTIALILLLIGVILLWVSQKKKRKHQEFLDEIDLE